MDIIHSFYCSKPWRELSYNLKIERGGTCSRCKKVINDTSLLIGHHTIELTEENIKNPQITLNPDLIEIICFDCHNAEHRRFGYERQIYLVWGSPLSGKSTYVRQVFKQGDIILDIDTIWQAVTYMPSHVKPNNCRFNVFALKNALYDQIKTRYGNWSDAYVIGGYPNPYEREQLITELGAEAIYCESTREECLRRRQLAQRSAEYDSYINKWWDTHERYEKFAEHPPGGQ